MVYLLYRLFCAFFLFCFVSMSFGRLRWLSTMLRIFCMLSSLIWAPANSLFFLSFTIFLYIFTFSFILIFIFVLFWCWCDARAVHTGRASHALRGLQTQASFREADKTPTQALRGGRQRQQPASLSNTWWWGDEEFYIVYIVLIFICQPTIYSLTVYCNISASFSFSSSSVSRCVSTLMMIKIAHKNFAQLKLYNFGKMNNEEEEKRPLWEEGAGGAGLGC